MKASRAILYTLLAVAAGTATLASSAAIERAGSDDYQGGGERSDRETYPGANRNCRVCVRQ